MLVCSPPARVRAWYELMTLIVDESEEHADTRPRTGLRLGMCVSDLLPARSFRLFRVGLGPFSTNLPLRKVALACAPPGCVAMPRWTVLDATWVAPEQHATQNSLLFRPVVAPRLDKPRELRRAMELSKHRLTPRRMYEPANCPRFLLHASPVHVALRAVDLRVRVLGGTRLGHTAPCLSQRGDPRAVYEIVDDHKAVIVQMLQALRRGTRGRQLRKHVSKRRGSVLLGISDL
jgi:hypothetical protein